MRLATTGLATARDTYDKAVAAAQEAYDGALESDGNAAGFYHRRKTVEATREAREKVHKDVLVAAVKAAAETYTEAVEDAEQAFRVALEAAGRAYDEAVARSAAA